MKCYWLVKTNDPDTDKIIYTTEEYKINETINFENDSWRVIDKEIIK